MTRRKFVSTAAAAAGALAGGTPLGQSLGAADAPARAEPDAGKIDDRRVLVITADGLRPDVLLRAQAPNLRGLMRAGAFTMWAQTVPECYTLPAHVSLFTGVTPQRHGVTWNNHIEGAYSQVPTLFTLAKQAGRSTAIAVGKTKFVALTPPESLDWKFQPMDEPVAETEVAKRATAILHEHRPDLMFVHFPAPDNAGHAHGWGSPQQLQAVGEVDAAAGTLLATLADLKLRDQTLILFTSDHGGAAREHGPDDPRSRHVPWIASGPGVRRGYDLTLVPKLTLRAEDTFATAATFLELEAPKDLDGKPVEAIYEHRELLQPHG